MVKILDQFGRPFETRETTRGLRSQYDAAQTDSENYKHWSKADDLTANQANSPGVRRTLRNRSRYERRNNSYCKGLVATLAHDLVGAGGPRPSLNIPGANSAKVQQIEGSYRAWVRATGYTDKLRVKTEAKIGDGESFSIMVTNPRVRHDIKLDIRTYEADQVTTPFMNPFSPQAVDGIELDEHGNPIAFHFLRYAPSQNWWALPTDTERIDAANVLHWFRPDRPGQLRGVPEITPALPLFAQLRRYTLATIAAAEIAAMLAGVMKTNGTAQAGGPEQPKLYDAIELVRGALLALPEGWDAEQFDAKQPVATYKEFKAEILNEIARCVHASFNIIAGNSSGYNYSSGRLDHVIYHRAIRVERSRMEQRVLDPVFRAWLDEAALTPGVIPDGLPPIATWDWSWYWDGFESIDPEKDARANVTLLASLQTNYQEIYAEAGQNWETEFRQIAREKALMAELGLAPSDVIPAAPTEPPQVDQPEDPPRRRPAPANRIQRGLVHAG